MNYCNPEGFKNQVKELLERGDIDAFYSWFDGGETKEGAFKKGADVFNRVILPFANKYLGNKFTDQGCTALDLGYGAGTQIKAAMNFFKIVYGLDVHDRVDFVFENLDIPKEKHVRLIIGDGYNIPLNKPQIDFIYSWVTLCHVGTIDNVEKYLKEIKRVLKPGGVAVLFYTRLIRSSKNQSWEEVEKDMEKEGQHEMGYREGGPKSRVRTINLVLSYWKMKALALKCKFEVLEKTASWDDTESGRIYHGQYGIVLRKPVPKAKKKTNQLKRKKK